MASKQTAKQAAAAAAKKSSAEVQKIIDTLKGAKNDTEKMAALFLVTKVVKGASLTRDNRLALFEAIGFKFLLRLLNSPSSPDCPDILYKSVALSILTAFCADPTIAERPEMLEAIPTFLQILEKADDADEDDDQMLMVISETYHCLKSLAQVEKGREALCKSGAIEKLSSLYAHHAFNAEAGLEIIAAVGTTQGAHVWDKSPEVFLELMERLALQFEEDQSDQKFELCVLMAGIIPTANISKEQLETTGWPSAIFKGIIDILSSKITEKQRNPALRLASAMLTTMGVDWVLSCSDPANPYQFLILLIHLSCIEVRMTLEDRSLEKIMKNDDLIGSCYAIIETTMRFMAGKHFEKLDEKQKEQVFNSLKGAYSAMIGLINMIMTGAAKDPNKFWTDKMKNMACASVRCLAGWLAEESMSMKEEVYRILPFVLALVFETFQDAEGSLTPENQVLAEMGKCSDPIMPEVLVTLLPALCHLTAEERGVRMLLDSEGEEHLLRFLNHNWSVYKNISAFKEKLSRPGKAKKNGGGRSVEEEAMAEKSPEEIERTLLRVRVALMNVSNLFINMTVLDTELATSSPTFQQVMRWSFGVLPMLNTNEHDLPLLANVSALGLLLLLHITKKTQGAKEAGAQLSPEEEFIASRLVSGGDNAAFKFGQTVVKFIWEAHLPDESQSPVGFVLTSPYRSVWLEIKEMWFLTLQTTGALMEGMPWLADFCAESGFLEALISNLSQAYKNRIDSSTLAAYEDFLCAASRSSPNAINIIKTKGAALAKSHHLRTLTKALKELEGGGAEA